MSAVAVTAVEQRHVVNVRGEFLRLPALVNCEACFEGPAGTAKTRTILEYIHLVLKTFPGVRALITRKRLVDLTASAVVTYSEEVKKDWDGVKWYGGSQREPPAFIYPNGSKLMLAGMDKPEKVKSRAFHLIYPNEATELEESDIEMLRSRLGRDPRLPFWQLILDANPGPPTHWLNQRMNAGRTMRLRTFHRDNPAFYDDAGNLTPIGDRYINGTLAGLTGVRYKRLALGEWAAAEGTVYEGAWEPERNHPPRRAYSRRPDSLWGDCGVDRDWPRYMAIDWGYRAPLVVQWYARAQPDGELILYREIYVTMRTVEEVAKEALGYMGWRMTEQGQLVPTREDCDPLPREIVADVDPGDRATWEAHFGLRVFPATKGKDSISDGIQAVTRRLSEGRLLVLQNSLVARDPLLDEKKQPQGFAEEIEAYVWDTRAGRAPREVPMDDHDHAQDAARYLVQYFDREPQTGGAIEFEAVGF